MTVSDDELLQSFLRTSMLLRREQQANQPPSPGRDHGHQYPHNPGPPPGGPDMPPDHRQGPPPPRRPPNQHQAQGRVLAMLQAQEGLSQKDLAYVLGIRPQSLTETLWQLEEAGYIERRKNPHDGRVINVYLTDLGRERAEQAAASRRSHAQGALSSLSKKDKEDLSRILDKLRDALE